MTPDRRPASSCRHPGSAASECRSAKFVILLLLVLLNGCASVYFRDAGTPPARALRYSLAELPFSEYWTGIVFNGDKIGYARFNIRPVGGGLREIASEASFVLRFLGVEKKVHLRARDVVDEALQLREFAYDYRIDGSEQLISGRRSGATLDATVVTGGVPQHQSFAVREPLHPTSIIALYPVVSGLELDREYRYLVYDGQMQKLATVEQRVESYEKSEFFSGNAFKLTTSLHGQRTTTWIDSQGRPVFELAMRGVMIAALEDEARARQYVALAAVNQRETLIEFSLIRPDAPVREPRRASYMKALVQGLDRTPPEEAFQNCRPASNGHECEIRPEPDFAIAGATRRPQQPVESYLAPSATVQSRHPNIRITAGEIAGGERDPARLVEKIVRWMQTNIEKAPLDVFSAIDVLDRKKAECQGHAYLYTALARALGIPTRIANGLAYSEQFEGFLFHSWAESWIGDRWLPVDPTFGQSVADATHIKLLEGEALADLLPLIDWVGRLKIRVLALEHRGQ
jgi:hypothetical protein